MKFLQIPFYLTLCMFFSVCFSLNLAQEPNKQITVRDIDFTNQDDENSLFIFLQIQEEFAMTLKQFNASFKSYLNVSGIQKRIDKGQIPIETLIDLKRNYLIQLIDNELFYQEGLKDPNIKIYQPDIDRNVDKQMALISQYNNITFEQFLERENLSYLDFTKRVKKEMYTKKVLAEKAKFIGQFTPSEIEDFYKIFTSQGRFSKKFREVYLAELPIGKMEEMPKPDSFKNLSEFQNFAHQYSIHFSAKSDGKIEDVPFVLNIEFKNNKNLVSNLLYDAIWKAPFEKVIETQVNDRIFYIWVNKELEKQSYMTQEIQAFIIRQLNIQKKIEMEQNFTYKVATSASFKIRYKNELLTLNLKKFLKDSFEIQTETEE